MKHINGAQRPTSTCNVLWIAVVAIFLVVATAAAAFSQYAGDKWFGMGPDNVMGVEDGMMPPNGMLPPPGSGGRHGTPTVNCDAARSLTVTQPGAHHHSYKYVSTKHGCVYTIARDGKPWATVTYDASTATYKLTDPSGSGRLILQLGIPRGLFAPTKVKPVIDSEQIIKLTPHPVATP